MAMTKILFGLACVGIVWNIVASILIYNELKRRGSRASFFWLRIKAPIYAYRYKEITKVETGKVGPLFFHWIISINSALAIAIVIILILVFR
jgi:hypothetical protein